MLQYTGGTTGRSKAAMLSHGNLVSSLYQIEERFGRHLPDAGMRILIPLPLYHIYAFTLSLIFCFHQGLQSVLIPNPRDLNAFVRLMRKQKFEGFIGISTLYRSLLSHPDIAKVDFSSLRLCSSGGMSLNTEVGRLWHGLTGVQLLDGYGLTEASPCVSITTPEDWQEGTVGRPLCNTDICIRNEQGVEVPPGLPGEICVRGPQIMSGYWQQPEETAKVLDQDGWLASGDVGMVREDGHLQVLDRIKDVINVSGFNVFPNDIEEHVGRYPGVKEVVAFGRKKSDGTEKIILCIVRSDPELTEKALMDWCREGLTPYKVPKEIQFRVSLPKSNVGKVLRRLLREEDCA